MAAGALRVRADLCVQVDVPGGGAVRGHLTGAGSDLTLTVDRPEVFAGSGDAASIRDIAAEVARLGLRVHVENTAGRRLLSIGDVRSPWWQRAFTRSPHLRVAHLAGAVASARGRARGGEAMLPAAGLRPPATPYPIAPTFLRRPVRRVTTTHDPHHGGLPRLVVVPADGIWVPEQKVHWLQREVTSVGSDPACDVVLPGLDPCHAEVRHDGRDEFVVVAHGPVKVNGQPVTEALLRTGSRVDVGGHRLAFVREEYADHGRPFGGRIGGELGYQRPQPPREEISR